MTNISSKYINFLKGFVTPFVIRAKINNLIKPQSEVYEDYIAIQSDWQQVGEYMKSSMEVCCGEAKK